MARRVAFDAQPLLSRRERLKRRRDLAVAPVGKSSRRSYRQTITKVDLWSVLKISVCFYLGALVVVLAAGIALWEIARVAGVVDSIQHFMRPPARIERLHVPVVATAARLHAARPRDRVPVDRRHGHRRRVLQPLRRDHGRRRDHRRRRRRRRRVAERSVTLGREPAAYAAPLGWGL